jgi:hypothetical protein
MHVLPATTAECYVFPAQLAGELQWGSSMCAAAEEHASMVNTCTEELSG